MVPRLLALLAALFAINAAQAQPHLVPEAGALATDDNTHAYRNALRATFSPAGYGEEVRLRMVFTPSFGREMLVALRETSSDEVPYEVITMEPDTSVYRMWSRVGADSAGTSAAQVEALQTRIDVALQTAPLDSAEAAQIEAAWESALLATRYPSNPEIVTDSFAAHFSMWAYGRGALSGHTHSPPEGTPARQLVLVGLQLRGYARTGDRSFLEKALRYAEQVQTSIDAAEDGP